VRAFAAVALATAALVAAGLATARDSVVLHRLVSDRQDAQLVNAWGLAASPTGPWWVANEARSSSTLYAGDGHKQALTVGVPGGPTGVVYNPGRGFAVHAAGRSAPAKFLYACEDGMIRGWAPTVPHTWSAEAVVAYDSGASGALFRGITLAGGHLYASDFHNARVIEFDARWHRVVRRGAFSDPRIPAWYAPFNIAAFRGRLFVTYAWRAPVNGNDAPTGGYVDEFSLDGRLLARLGTPHELDEPWGIAMSPSGKLYVANFGTGVINVYAQDQGRWRLQSKLPVKVPGVWGIAFGTGGMSGPRTTLFYAAGPHRWHGASEVDIHGAFGAINLAG
jgi:uncharacterized protein (TIGR03118 family)